MLRIEGTEPAQLLDHFRCDLLRFAIFRAAMNTRCPPRPMRHARCVLRSTPSGRRLPPYDPPREKLSAGFEPFTLKVLRQPDPLKFATQNLSERRADLEQPELDARRAAIDRQDAGLT
jgi:hypothetical protein